MPAASLTAKGTVQLSSAINSTSEILAATPKAVKAARRSGKRKTTGRCHAHCSGRTCHCSRSVALFYRSRPRSAGNRSYWSRYYR
ncbi:phage tail protein [Escherichia coli]|uniref:phage tail protein n=1 Tax=Escherichia coli TaxID=562 RepID=UPI003D80A573